MPVYSYTFRDASGGQQKGTAEAESEEILRKRFEEQGFTITEVTMIKAKGAKVKRSVDEPNCPRQAEPANPVSLGNSSAD